MKNGPKLIYMLCLQWPSDPLVPEVIAFLLVRYCAICVFLIQTTPIKFLMHSSALSDLLPLACTKQPSAIHRPFQVFRILPPHQSQNSHAATTTVKHGTAPTPELTSPPVLHSCTLCETRTLRIRQQWLATQNPTVTECVTIYKRWFFRWVSTDPKSINRTVWRKSMKYKERMVAQPWLEQGTCRLWGKENSTDFLGNLQKSNGFL
jgi:hypothetical protein